jgi:hypothetical protein
MRSPFHTWLTSRAVPDSDFGVLGLERLRRGETRSLTLLNEPGTLHGVEVH